MPVAKLDIASDSDSEDRGFESRRARQNCTAIVIQCVSGLRCSFFVKSLAQQAISCTVTRKLFPTSPPETTKTGSDGRWTLHTLARLIFERSKNTQLLRAFVIKWETDLGAVSFSEKEAIAVEKGSWPLSRTLAPVLGGQGNRPHDRPRRLSRRQGANVGGALRLVATPLQSPARSR